MNEWKSVVVGSRFDVWQWMCIVYVVWWTNTISLMLSSPFHFNKADSKNTQTRQRERITGVSSLGSSIFVSLFYSTLFIDHIVFNIELFLVPIYSVIFCTSSNHLCAHTIGFSLWKTLLTNVMNTQHSTLRKYVGSLCIGNRMEIVTIDFFFLNENNENTIIIGRIESIVRCSRWATRIE